MCVVTRTRDSAAIINYSSWNWRTSITRDWVRLVIVINVGPNHPSTHGVLRILLLVEGESIK